MNRLMTVVTVVVLLLVSTAAFAQYTTTVLVEGIALVPARQMGMGGVGVAAADDAGAINYNPANLASLDIAPPAGMYSQYDPYARPWNWQIAGTAEVSGDMDFWGAHLAGTNPQSNWGIGASYQSVSPSSESNWWMVGTGAQLGSSNCQWGVSVMDADLYGGKTTFNVGLLYTQQLTTGPPLRIGLTAEDVTDELNVGPFFNVGLAYPVMVSDDQQLLLAADLLDATNQMNSTINVGMEFRPCANWAIRGGLINIDDSSNTTAGLGYDGGSWRVDVAWQEWPGSEDEIAATCPYVLK